MNGDGLNVLILKCVTGNMFQCEEQDGMIVYLHIVSTKVIDHLATNGRELDW
jgi:hypothetical protein